MIGQVWARLKLLFAQGEGVLIGHERIQASVLDEEPLPNIKRVEPYGFSYRPKPGCQTYLVFPSGDRANGIALIVGDKRYQMTLEGGEVALHDDEENWVYIKRGGVIEAKAATKVVADTPLVEATGNMIVRGTLTAEGGYYGTAGGAAQMHSGAIIQGGLTVNGKNVSDSHTHPVSGSHTLGVD